MPARYETWMIAAAACVTLGGEAFAQGGTTAQSPGMGSARSGSALDSEAGGEAAAGMRRDPHSGTMSPDASQGRGNKEGISPGAGQTERTAERSDEDRNSPFQGMAQVPAGIGERGTGQTQSTLERSGGRSHH
jgi:hypothetical protein